MVRDFILIRESELAALDGHVQAAARNWADRWLAPSTAWKVSACRRGVPDGAAKSLHLVRTSGPGNAYVELDRQQASVLLSGLLGMASPPPSGADAGTRYQRWVEGVVADALGDLAGAVMGQAAPVDATTPSARMEPTELAEWPVVLSAPGSGTIFFRLELGAQSLTFVIDGRSALHLMGVTGRRRPAHLRRGGLFHLSGTVSREAVGVEIRTTPTSILYDELCALEAGDVVTFDHSVQEPLQVIAGESVLGRAWVGRDRQSRAARLNAATK